ncbi:MAG: hypothetical protein M3Q44_07370 [bacterium]|nr:hypothetical protein [bacterium]
MKGRMVSPDFWMHEGFAECNPMTKLLFSYLINNQHIKLTQYVYLPERQVRFDTGLDVKHLETGKHELEQLRWVFFYNSWIYHNHTYAYLDYKGNEKINAAKQQEIAAIPQEIKDHFERLLRGSEEVANLSESSPIPIPEKITEEDKGVLGEKEKDESSTKTIAYLTNLPREDLDEFVRIYAASDDQVAGVAEKIVFYCQSKGKRYHNYKATLHQWLNKDFGKRKTPAEPITDMEALEREHQHYIEETAKFYA